MLRITHLIFFIWNIYPQTGFESYYYIHLLNWIKNNRTSSLIKYHLHYVIHDVNHLNNIKILRPKVTKNLTNLP